MEVYYGYFNLIYFFVLYKTNVRIRSYGLTLLQNTKDGMQGWLVLMGWVG